MKTAICPGSFDPVTIGHIDIIRRAAKLFDKVIVVVMFNYHKPTSYFTADERVELIKRSTTDIENIEVETYSGLLADYAAQKGACAVVKGLRAVSDFEYEFQQALTNKKLNPEMETMFLTASDKYTFVSSSNVKEIARHGGDLKAFLPWELIDEVTEMARKEK